MRRQRGFTLVEIMIAVLISAIVSVMAFGAMREALAHRTIIRERSARLVALTNTISTLTRDLGQMQPRPVREPVGSGHQPVLRGTTSATPEIVFTRGGWSNPVGNSRSSLQRVRYVLRDGVLYREYWLVLDAQIEPQPVSRRLLDRVRDFQVRYMDDGRNWQSSWPPATPSGSTGPRELRWRPIAVEVSLTLEDWGVVTRIIEVAG
jgi:general secretion pathway protein J